MQLIPLTGTVTDEYGKSPDVQADATYTPHGDGNKIGSESLSQSKWMQLIPLTGTVTYPMSRITTM